MTSHFVPEDFNEENFLNIQRGAPRCMDCGGEIEETNAAESRVFCTPDCNFSYIHRSVIRQLDETGDHTPIPTNHFTEAELEELLTENGYELDEDTIDGGYYEWNLKSTMVKSSRKN